MKIILLRRKWTDRDGNVHVVEDGEPKPMSEPLARLRIASGSWVKVGETEDDSPEPAPGPEPVETGAIRRPSHAEKQAKAKRERGD